MLLQDAAILLTMVSHAVICVGVSFDMYAQESWAQHPIFKEDIFETEAFKGFQSNLLASVRAAQVPEHIQLRQVVPSVASQLGIDIDSQNAGLNS